MEEKRRGDDVMTNSHRDGGGGVTFWLGLLHEPKLNLLLLLPLSLPPPLLPKLLALLQQQNHTYWKVLLPQLKH